jgi:signal transduction histidine kinase
VSKRLRLYLVAAGFGAAIVLAANVPADLPTMWIHYAIWTALCVLSETMWISTLSGSGTWSMSSTAILATVVLYGHGAPIWIAAISTPIAELVVQHKPWVRAYFNSAQIAITLWAASSVFVLLGGPEHGLASLGVISAGVPIAIRLAPPIVGLFAVYLVVNRALVAVAVSWSTERPYWRVMREDWFYAERLLEDAAAFFLSPLMVISYQAIGYLGVALFYAPVRMIYESEKRFAALRRAQDQAIHSERLAAKGEMAAEIGHELRNQLAAISGRAQLILKEGEGGGGGASTGPRRHAEIILEQSRRMEALSKGLMDFSRAELTIERVDVNALIQRTIEFVRTQNRFDGIEWDVRLAERLPELRADPGQLQQVLLNLFLNAADAIQEKGAVGRRAITVVSEAEERSRQARLTVRDTGPGITPSNLARIFEPHFTTKREGHGFGLSTSYRIITNHGGRITVDSPPGQGATFTITLPLHGPGGWS